MKLLSVLLVLFVLALATVRAPEPAPSAARYVAVPCVIDMATDSRKLQWNTVLKLDTTTGKAWLVRYTSDNGYADWVPVVEMALPKQP